MNHVGQDLSTASKANSSDPGAEEEFVARAFNVPGTLSSELYTFLATSELSTECKRALIGLNKYILASILRQIQRAINQACREKGQIVNAARATRREQKPPTSNTYYRSLFRDSSKRGEISTYLVKNTVLGQFRHLESKFPHLREVLADATLADVAPFLMCNYVTHSLRRALSSQFRWKLSHVRPQLRGMRRLMERAHAFNSALKLTSKSEEFISLREGVEALLHAKPHPPGLQLGLLEKLLNKFQKGHVLHVLLLSREKIHGLYPKLIKLKGMIYSAQVIEQQLELFQQFCETNRVAVEELVNHHLSGVVRLLPREIVSAIEAAVQEHDRYLAFLEENQYGTYHAKRKHRALAALQTNTAWRRYLECGVIPSERYLKSLAKLVTAFPDMRVKSEAALYSIIPVAFLTKVGMLQGCSRNELLQQFLAVLTAENCTNSPFTSPHNRKRYTPIDLTPLNNEFLIVRPGNKSNDLLTDYLRQGRPVPLQFVPSEVLTFYTGSATGKLSEATLQQFVRKLLSRKNYKSDDVETVLQLISFNGIGALSRRTLQSRRCELSAVARFLVNPVLEINLFTNKRLKGGLQKVKAIINNPEVELAPIRILPVDDLNNTCTCQLIFTSKEVQPEFKSQIRCMKGIKIGELRKEEIVGIDVNQEDENKLYVAPDWDSSAQYIQATHLEQQLKRPIYNEAQDKQFTAYIHNGSGSERVSDEINTLSGELKANLSHLKTIKVMKKRVQGAFGKTKLHTIASASGFYNGVVQVARLNGLNGEAEVLQEVLTIIKGFPKHRVHELRQLRDNRKVEIQGILTALKQLGSPVFDQIQLQFNEITERGKKIHRQETELNRLQQKINDLRKEITQKLSRLVGMILCEVHPDKLVYEALNVKHQGLKGVLGEATKHIPDMAEFIAKAVEIADLYGKLQGVSIQTEVYGVHPGGTSSPPHIPTGLDFERGGKKGWHEVTIPATVKNGVSYPQLKFNSHVLACQKLCEKVRSI